MLKNSQLFEIYDSPKYFITYGDIKEKGMGLVLDEIRLYYKHKRPSELHMMNMMEYVNKFVSDVDDYFKPMTFFKYEWIYPIFKNKWVMNETEYITIEAHELEEMQTLLRQKLKEEVELRSKMSERAIELRASLDMIDWFKQRNIYDREYKIKN